jgi:hypothetical protein
MGTMPGTESRKEIKMETATKKEKRWGNALSIQAGACNPSGIVHALLAAIQEMRDGPDYTGTDSVRQDPALRLIVHQLAYLMGIEEVDQDLLLYGKLSDVCKAKAIENGETGYLVE